MCTSYCKEKKINKLNKTQTEKDYTSEGEGPNAVPVLILYTTLLLGLNIGMYKKQDLPLP